MTLRMIAAIPLELVPEIGSTSETLKQRAAAGSGEAALLATVQTAGRGRLGRSWSSPAGNLHVSVLLWPGVPVMPGHWSLLAAVALAACVAEGAALATGRLRLKWPNDLMLDGGKLAGILLDSGGTPPWLVIGFGMNLVAAPAGLGRAVACLGDHQVPPTPEAMARRLLARLAAWRVRYEAEGFAPVRAAWLDLGPEPGDPIRVGATEGRFQGLGPDGALLLDVAGETRSIVSGEVQ